MKNDQELKYALRGLSMSSSTFSYYITSVGKQEHLHVDAPDSDYRRLPEIMKNMQKKVTTHTVPQTTT